jgi:hypothetical protein
VSVSYDIDVTWMDGKQETYFSTRLPRVVDGEVVVTEEYGISGGVKEEYHLPQANIRVWKPVLR